MNKIYSLETFNFVSKLFINNLQTILDDNVRAHYKMGDHYIDWLKKSIQLSLEFCVLYSESIQFNENDYNQKYFRANLLNFLNEELSKIQFKKINGFYLNYTNQKKLIENKIPLEIYFQLITESILKKYYTPFLILKRYEYGISEFILKVIQPTYLMKHTLEELTHDVILEI